jgi:hypothetical protein
MLYWNEIINDLAKYLHGFVIHVLRLYAKVTNVLCLSLLSHDRYQYDKSNSVQTHLNISTSTLATAVVMRSFISFKLTGSGGTKILSLLFI